MNAQALKHKGAMVEVYSKMKPDTFKLQLQTVLTAYYEDIKLVVSASSCTKSKVVAANDNDGNADAANPATQQDGGAAAASCREEPPQAPSPIGRSGCCKGLAGGGGKKAFGKA